MEDRDEKTDFNSPFACGADPAHRACGLRPEGKIHIVFLGDSIAEGIAGMRPVSERERDAYYGVLGIRNGYDFKNRAISGLGAHATC